VYRFLLTLMALFSVPIILLEVLGGIVSGIWLVILGQWGHVLGGLLFFVVAAFLLSFVLFPGVALAMPGLYFYRKGYKSLLYPFGFLSSLYQVVAITGWCIFILHSYMQHADRSSFIPLLVWSYVVATGPLRYMAKKENQGTKGLTGATLATFFAQVAYVVVMLTLGFLNVTLLDVTLIFGAIMLVPLFGLFGLALVMDKRGA